MIDYGLSPYPKRQARRKSDLDCAAGIMLAVILSVSCMIGVALGFLLVKPFIW